MRMWQVLVISLFVAVCASGSTVFVMQQVNKKQNVSVAINTTPSVTPTEVTTPSMSRPQITVEPTQTMVHTDVVTPKSISLQISVAPMPADTSNWKETVLELGGGKLNKNTISVKLPSKWAVSESPSGVGKATQDVILTNDTYQIIFSTMLGGGIADVCLGSTETITDEELNAGFPNGKIECSSVYDFQGSPKKVTDKNGLPVWYMYRRCEISAGKQYICAKGKNGSRYKLSGTTITYVLPSKPESQIIAEMDLIITSKEIIE